MIEFVLIFMGPPAVVALILAWLGYRLALRLQEALGSKVLGIAFLLPILPFAVGLAYALDARQLDNSEFKDLKTMMAGGGLVVAVLAGAVGAGRILVARRRG